jgi:hypothetical protein
MKRYVPVRNFERQTSYCPTYIAWQVLDEARDYLRAPIPDRYARKLARRAEAVFRKHEFWQRKYRGANGREWLLASMRHWLAAVLAKSNPVQFQALPDSYKAGRRLPERRTTPFVHGCELLLP